MNRFNKNFPNYDDDSDYNTNANSYYKDLGRKTKLIKLLAKRIWEYEETLDLTLEQIEQRLTDYISENDDLMSERLENWDKRIDEMPEEMSSLFVEWLNDGTLEQIINDDVLGNKADKTYVDNELDKKSDKSYVDTELGKKSDKRDLSFKLSDFGAVSDGKTDDSQAFINAVKHIDSVGGGTLTINRGVTLLKPKRDRPFELCSNLTIEGYGDSSIIKIHDDTGDYWGVFGQLNSGEKKLENVTFNNFKVDQNPSGNTDVNMSSDNINTENWRQFVITLRNFDNVNIMNMTFSPTTAVNTITCNRGETERTSKLKISNNLFIFARSNGDPEYDNSAIYANVDGAIITDNMFYSDSGLNARGCIETHGGNSVISNNYSDGYFTGVNMVGRKQNIPTNMTISNNTFNNVCRGIQLWIHDGEMRNANITGNTLTVDPERYTTESYFGGILGAGSVDIENKLSHININNNNIDVKKHNNGNSYGIFLRLRHDINDLKITDNFIKNSSSTGIALGSTTGGFINGLKLSENYLVNCSTHSFSSYINISGSVSNALVENNMILDKGDTNSLNDFEIISGEFNNFYLKNNLSLCESGSLYSNLSGKIITDFEKIISVENGTVKGVERNQIFLDESNGVTELKRVAGHGSVGDLNYDLILTYNEEENCYTANETSGLKSGTWLDINGVDALVKTVKNGRIYTTGTYQNITAQPVDIKFARLDEVRSYVTDSNGNRYLIEVDNEGVLRTVKG